MTISCGIDFGTSNSAAAITGCDTRLVPVEGDQITIPSAIFFDEEEKKALYGREAQDAYVEGYDGRFMRSLKRVLGTVLMDEHTVVNGKAMRFQNIIGGFLRNLKNNAEAVAEQDLEHVVMGRPVFFIDGDKEGNQKAQNELEEIARLIGFKHVSFQYEPIAAAFAHEQKVSKESLAIVVDVGGGTSDFTLVRLSPDRKEEIDRSQDILANTGVRIGGNDFDKDLSIAAIMPSFGYGSVYGEKELQLPRADFYDLSEWSKINFVYTQQTLRYFQNILKQSQEPEKIKRLVTVLEQHRAHHVLGTTESAKIALTEQDKVEADLEYIEEGLRVPVTIKQLNTAIKNDVAKVSGQIKECTQMADVKTDQVDMIILTGGSTEIPYVQQMLCKHFPNAEISQENKLSSVALGLSYDAERVFA